MTFNKTRLSFFLSKTFKNPLTWFFISFSLLPQNEKSIYISSFVVDTDLLNRKKLKAISSFFRQKVGRRIDDIIWLHRSTDIKCIFPYYWNSFGFIKAMHILLLSACRTGQKTNECQLPIREKPNHQQKISVKYAAIKNKDYCHTTVRW